MKPFLPHQYIARTSSAVTTEPLLADRWISLLYSTLRENTPYLYTLLTSPRCSAFLAALNYDIPYASPRRMIRDLSIDLSECLESPEALDTPRKVFERKIRYWECRPLPEEEDAILAPSDARVLVGSFRTASHLFIKEKFFSFQELLGEKKAVWLSAFENGAFALFRLTPDKYHYTHAPVSGKVLDFYEVAGACHSCNPTVVIEMATPFSKNRRTVTIIDTNVPGGTGAGVVAMVEVAALMIGDLVQCYSEERYDHPVSITPGMFLKKGQPKGLFRPGSSVVILLFQEYRTLFCHDILRNLSRTDAQSRYSEGLGKTLVETDVAVRSAIAHKKEYHGK